MTAIKRSPVRPRSRLKTGWESWCLLLTGPNCQEVHKIFVACEGKSLVVGGLILVGFPNFSIFVGRFSGWKLVSNQSDPHRRIAPSTSSVVPISIAWKYRPD